MSGSTTSGGKPRRRDKWRTFLTSSSSSPSTPHNASGNDTSSTRQANSSISSSVTATNNTALPLQSVKPPTATTISSTSGPTSVSSRSSDILQNAWKQLPDEYRNILEPYIPSSVADADEALQLSLVEAKKKQQQCDEKRWKFTFAQRTIILRDTAGKVVKWLDRFKDIGNLVAGIDPVHVGLPWAGFRFILEVAISDEKQMASLLVGCEMALYVINRVKVYVGFLENVPSSLSRTNFEVGLVQLCAIILSFLAKAIKIYKSSAAKRGLVSFWQGSDVQDFEQECDKVANRVEIEAKNCDRTLSSEDRMTLQQMQEALQRIEHDHRLQASLDQLEARIDLSNLKFVAAAAFDAYGQIHQECHANTRVDLLYDIQNWAVNPDSRSIYWLQGMAGTGKSTISYTFAKWLSKRDESNGVDLGASFFFKRGEGDRESAALLFPTIVHQLTRKIPGLGSIVARAVGQNPDVCGKALGEQWDTLLNKPFKELQFDTSNKIHIVIIDALDECKTKDIDTVVQLWYKLVKKCPADLRLFFTSRPDLHIRTSLGQIASDAVQEKILHDVDPAQVKEDILVFFKSRFADIRGRYDYHSYGAKPLDGDWPGPKVLQELADMAVPLFIVASTICLFVDEYGEIPPEQLDIILRSSRQEGYISQMGKTYLPILKQLENPAKARRSQDELYADFRAVVGCVVTLAEPLSKAALATLLHIPITTISKRLQHLSSVLQIPNDVTTPVRRLHLSFGEFLTSEDIVGEPFHVDSTATHKMLLTKCLDLLFRPSPVGLHENMCQLSYPGQSRQDLSQETVQARFPPAIQYACRYWTQHALSSAMQIVDQDVVHVFLQKHFLHWLEALSLLNSMADTVTYIENLRSLVSPSNSVDVAAFLNDARRFVVSFRYIVNLTPLQLYSSTIAFAPRESIIRGSCGQVPSWIKRDIIVPETWGPELQQLEGHTAVVHAVAFSPDGDLLASASKDGTIRLWNVKTGREVQKLNHWEGVRAVIFSPNGSQIASADDDGAIKLWNVQTGQEMQKMIGHRHLVTAIAFSSDSSRLASVSLHGRVWIWNTITGEVEQTEEPGGKQIDMGKPQQTDNLGGFESIFDKFWLEASEKSENEAVDQGYLISRGLRDSEEEYEEQDSLEGSDEPEERKEEEKDDDDDDDDDDESTESRPEPPPLYSVVFSSDDCQLAIASGNGTVRIWDVKRWQEVQTLDGHTDSVLAVAFSSEGSLLASASQDGTVRLWNVKTWQEVQRLEGHIGSVEAIVFSPDGKFLASAGEDRTARLWDTRTWREVQKLEGHTWSIRGLTLSPDSNLLASASGDMTVRLWDVRIEQEAQQSERHTHSINSVLFSPDGSQLISTSRDQTARLWDVATGREMQQLKHAGEVMKAIFLPDGSKLATILENDVVQLWDAKTWQELHKLEYEKPIGSVAFSPDGSQLATANWERIVRVWDVATGQVLQKLKHPGSVVAVAFSPDGNQLASGIIEGRRIQLWDARNGQVTQVLLDTGNIARMTFSSDGSQLASGYQDHTVRLWDLKSGHQIKRWEDCEQIRDLRFTTDGLTLLTDKTSIPINAAPALTANGKVKSRKGLVIRDDWIEYEDQKLLWLPPAYRTEATAIYGDLLALGRADGIITFIELHYVG